MALKQKSFRSPHFFKPIFTIAFLPTIRWSYRQRHFVKVEESYDQNRKQGNGTILSR